jgi:hypothetical protein
MNAKIQVGDLVTWKNSRLMVVEEDMYGYMVCAWIDKGKLGREILPEAELIKVELADPQATLPWDHHNTRGIEEHNELKVILCKLETDAAILSPLKSRDSHSNFAD